MWLLKAKFLMKHQPLNLTTLEKLLIILRQKALCLPAHTVITLLPSRNTINHIVNDGREYFMMKKFTVEELNEQFETMWKSSEIKLNSCIEVS